MENSRQKKQHGSRFTRYFFAQINICVPYTVHSSWTVQNKLQKQHKNSAWCILSEALIYVHIYNLYRTNSKYEGSWKGYFLYRMLKKP